MNQRYRYQAGYVARRASSGNGRNETMAVAQMAALPRTGGNGRWRWWLLGAAALLALLAWFGRGQAEAVTPAAGVAAAPALTVAEGVTIQGQPVSGMDRAQLLAWVEERYRPWLAAPLTLRFEERRWSPTPTELGLRFSPERLVDEALLAQPRRGFLGFGMVPTEIAPPLSIDGGQLQRYLQSISAEFEVAPKNATLRFNQQGEPSLTPARTGQQVLVDETAREIMAALGTLEPTTINLRRRPLEPALTDAQLEPLLAQARQVVSGTLRLQHEGRTWEWTPPRLSEWISISTERVTPTLTIQRDAVAQVVAEIARELDKPSQEPRVRFENGALAITQPGVIGQQVQQEEAVEALLAGLAGGPRELTLPITSVSPKITPENLASLGITALVSEGKSSFVGSAPYRITNIVAGARRMDGVLIPPGGTFSFNENVGEINESNGFVQGYAIVGNRTQLEWGGGVCQVSTTVFRAAFWAGLPFRERHTHAFYISWYDAYSYPTQAAPGMDAAIYTGQLDLRFENDTANWLLMQTIADEASGVLTVQLFGTPTGRSVRVDGPQIGNRVPAPTQPRYIDDPSLPSGTLRQSDVARAGMTITVHRIISENGSERVPELFVTTFQPWPNVFVRGTG
ncbi:MAG: VanW family protein [Chloroflexaceae bacterium]|jgi:vancomycin resistance protein YoaR|nr:VanW family protein [Chloroflexaceae bacterium]